MEVLEQHNIDEAFGRIWEANDITPGHPAFAAGQEDLENLQHYSVPNTVYVTDVTLRDGQQQRTDAVTTEQRVQVFDEIVRTGVDRIEIGHLGNETDQQLAGEIVRRVAESETTQEQYKDVKLQVLFGSQEELIQQGITVLETAFKEHYGDNWQEAMADKVIVHVYDRVDQNLINTASNPYDPQESARRITAAAQHAINAGFKHFSVSGEAATAAIPEVAIQYYRSINDYLVRQGVESVNVNLANTYGYSTNTEWNAATLTMFNGAVKHGFDNVTTSIHTHNDADNAVSFAMNAVVAGFDRVEGTINGMGERAGNVANIDVVARLIEAARHEVAGEYRYSALAHRAGTAMLSRMVALDPRVIANLGQWYSAAETISTAFGVHADYRWRRTSIGNPYAHDNGSSPHDGAMKAGIKNPIENPPYNNYEWYVLVTDILGRPGSADLAIADPDAIRAVTVNNHASGGSTRAIVDGEVPRADDNTVEKARAQYEDHRARVLSRLATGTMVVAG